MVCVGGLLKDLVVELEIIFHFIMQVCGLWFFVFTNIPGAVVSEEVARLVRVFFSLKKVL